ncbi:MAG: hypothetical protein GYA24_08250, partial [Candidatus Lokiarchaeota archaeon]|nr:hypothetical protein [Candidatus Lokiarchaeota archaeon]
MVKKWRFKFAEVDIYERKIVVSSFVDYKQLEKEYKNQVGKASNEIKAILPGLFEKKRMKETDVNSSQQKALVDFFNSIAKVDGVQVVEEKEPEPEPEVVPKRQEAAPRRDAGTGKSKYKLSIAEALDFKTEYDGKIADATVNGVVSVVNGGSKNRIWDIDLRFGGGEKADLPKEIHIPELDPGEEWKHEYKIKIGKEDAPL